MIEKLVIIIQISRSCYLEVKESYTERTVIQNWSLFNLLYAVESLAAFSAGAETIVYNRGLLLLASLV